MRGAPIRAAASAPRHAEKEFNRHAKHTSCACVASGHVGRNRLLLVAPTWLRRRKVLRTLRARLRLLRRPAHGRVWAGWMPGRWRGWRLRRRKLRRRKLRASKLRPLPVLPNTRLLRHPSGSCRTARRPGWPADGAGNVPVLHGSRPARFLRRSSAVHRPVMCGENRYAAIAKCSRIREDSASLPAEFSRIPLRGRSIPACTDNAAAPTIRPELGPGATHTN